MKFIVRLSSIALVSLSSVSPCLAANQSISRSTDSVLLSQSSPSSSKTIQVSGIFDTIDKVLNTVDRERQREEQRADRERARQERLEQQVEAEKVKQEPIERQTEAQRARQERLRAGQERIAENRRQRQEREAKKQAAIEQERKRFESLSPEQQKAYIAKKEAQRAAGLQLLGNVFGTLLMGGGDSTGSQGSQDTLAEDRDRQRRNEQFNRPEPQPAPAPVQPIAPLYGNGPAY